MIQANKYFNDYSIMESKFLTKGEFIVNYIVSIFENKFFHLAKYSEFPISSKLKDVIFLMGIRFISKLEFGLYRPSFVSTKKTLFKKIENIDINGKNKENSLIFWIMAFLIKLSILNSEKKLSRYGYRGFKSWNFPFFAHPDIKKLIFENKENIENFCKTFSSLDAPSINLITKLFEFLLDPLNYETYNNLYEERQKHDLFNSNLFISLGLKANKMNSKEYYSDLGNIFNLYTSEESYKKDMKELDEILNQDNLLLDK